MASRFSNAFFLFSLVYHSAASGGERATVSDYWKRCAVGDIPVPGPYCSHSEAIPSPVCLPASAGDIAKGKRVQNVSNSENITTLTNGPGWTEGIRQGDTLRLKIYLEQLYYVYSVVIKSDGEHLRPKVSTEFRHQSNKKKSIQCDWTGDGSNDYTFYCFTFSDEGTWGVLSSHLEILITNEADDRITSVMEIQAYEYQPTKCGRPSETGGWKVLHPDTARTLNSYEPGAKVTMQCNSSKMETTCQPGGQWSPRILHSCWPSADLALPELPSNAVLLSPRNKAQECVFTYSCLRGYKLPGGKSRETVECPNCTCSSPTPACQRVQCPYPKDVETWSWTLLNSTTVVGSLSRFTAANGSSWLEVCHDDGLWTPYTGPAVAHHVEAAQFYWLVVFPFVVLCILASLGVTYRERIRLWLKRSCSSGSRSAASSNLAICYDSNNASAVEAWDGSVRDAVSSRGSQYSDGLNHIYERVSLIVPVSEPPDEHLHSSNIYERVSLIIPEPCDGHPHSRDVSPIYATVQKKKEGRQ